jgi:outer membrane protein TolC
MRRRPGFALFVLTAWASQAILACAQTAPNVTPTAATEEAAPSVPATSPGPLTLDACIDLGYEHQPALAAARASLGASQAGQRALQKMIIPRALRPDLKIRGEQAGQGVTIAGAALTQAEWDTRYAITRNFFTVQYVNSQQMVVADVLRSLQKGRERLRIILASGDLNAKVTKLDIEAIDTQIVIVQTKKAQADNGLLKAIAALREAMGVAHDYPLQLAAIELPPAVYPVKAIFEENDYDPKGNATLKKKERIEFRQLYKINEKELIVAALANRGEIIQANAAARVVDLEICAQDKIRGWQGNTFAMGGDKNVQPIPQTRANGDWVPGGTNFEMPPMLAGRKMDRVERARFLAERAAAVVDKAENLVALDVVAQYLKWQEAAVAIQHLKGGYDKAQALPERVLKEMEGKDLTGVAIIQSNLTAINVRLQLNEEMHMHALALAGLERATAGAFRVYPIPAAPK